ncbi:Hypothetical predicted protein [Mytilus galloprovincialis]|uniref:Ubiquitin-like domain-containing protein n=1 Tax=Mytilus galloprovincialis TaxID=29158 RepID=A0A8B6DNV1_MYTGA|nr:Hypothetical predicted protein [Mytilus galloprovincialis]
MACIVCNEEKLSKEFAPYNASDNCDHPCLTCLRCLVRSVVESGKCAYPGCSQEIHNNCDVIVLFQDMLAKMFISYEVTHSPKGVVANDKSFVNVLCLTGNSAKIKYTPYMTVYDFKCHVSQAMRVNPKKQKILYGDTEIETYSPDNRLKTLAEYGVKPNTTICMVRLLYSISEDLNHVVFDLSWSFPDYLDASCLMFSQTTFYQVCDYANKNPHQCIAHSGDIMDNYHKMGHHKIDVSLHKIPPEVTHLFFTLSAWRRPNLAKYKDPSLQFYEASRPVESLCKTSFSHANESQAVIMCSVSRANSKWTIYELGKLTPGNAKRYDPIKETIRDLIKSGM